jgi:RNA polymerase sigma factor (sigma-70 family)
MTTEEYGSAYKKGYIRTARFLVSRGLSWDGARETAQAAWVKGWEKVGQLRDSKMVVNWINTIALNLYRCSLRCEPFLQELPDMPAALETHLAGIDVQLILQTCNRKDRIVLQHHYLEGHGVGEIARAQGLTETAVRVRLLRARRAAAKRLAANSRPTTVLAMAKAVNS